MDGAKLVSSAILGIDVETVFVGGKVYVIHPPTVRTMAGVVSCMRECPGETIRDIIIGMDYEGSAAALSWLVNGDASLKEEFLGAPLGEVQSAVITGLGMLDPANFIRLSALLRNVRRLTARPR